MKTKIYIGNDHAGFELKKAILRQYQESNFQFLDCGTYSEESVDYPDFAHKVAEEVLANNAIGILICGSANGVCITANKHNGIRAALAWLPEIATLARQHNDANIICLPARFITQTEAFEIVEKFLASEFEGGRHETRVNKINCK